MNYSIRTAAMLRTAAQVSQQIPELENPHRAAEEYQKRFRNAPTSSLAAYDGDKPVGLKAGL